MYVNYAIWSGGFARGGLVDDFLKNVGGDSTTGMGKNLLGWGIGQHNVTYRRNVALQCGCSVPTGE